MKIIEPRNIIKIGELQRNEIAFPDIDFKKDVPLKLGSPTIKRAYSNITAKIGYSYVEDIDWKKDGDVEWQNKMLQWLSNSIEKLIEDYNISPTEDMLTRIFVRIQLWGGAESRYQFVMGGGFEENYDQQIYKSAINLIMEQKFYQANLEMEKMKFFGTAFATKHIFFWSNKKAPIYDSLIAKLVFGRKTADKKYYEVYLNSLEELARKMGVTSAMIERNLFNWVNTPEGKQWLTLRLKE